MNLGDDADTVGAVTGQIAGATYGLSAIPEEWVSRLAWSERLVGIGQQLFHASLGSQKFKLYAVMRLGASNSLSF